MSKICQIMSDAQMKKQEEQWQAESDARMLAQYQELMDDKPRLKRAMAQAKKEAENLKKRFNAMNRASQQTPSKGK